MGSDELEVDELSEPEVEEIKALTSSVVNLEFLRFLWASLGSSRFGEGGPALRVFLGICMVFF